MYTPLMFSPIDCKKTYFLFELGSILRISRSTLFRLIKRCEIRTKKITFASKKRTVVPSNQLYKFSHSKTLSKYYLRVKNFLPVSSTFSATEFEFMRPFKLAFVLLSPYEQTALNKLGLSEREMLLAIKAALIPTIEVNSKQYIQPKFLELI